MNKCKRWLKLAATIFTGYLLISCGGGGDGGASAIRIELESPNSISAEVFETEKMPDVQIYGKAFGDLEKLNGRNIYVILEDPAQLFEKSVYSTFSPNGGFYISLVGVKQPKIGSYSGNLSLYACLDSQCKEQFNNSPIKIPYQVNVLPGLTLSTSTLNVTRVFGDVDEKIETVSGTLPKNLASLKIDNYSSMTLADAPFSKDAVLVVETKINGDKFNVSIRFNSMPPGAYKFNIDFQAVSVANLPSFKKTISVIYTVVDNPALDVVFDPPEGVAIMEKGFQNGKTIGYSTISRPGVKPIARFVEYLSSPVGAEGNVLYNQWWNQQDVYACALIDIVSRETSCLPPGTYTARIPYEYQVNGVKKEVFFPVRMIVE